MMPSETMKVTTPSDTELVVKREFDAPRAMVWDAMTKPELVRRWMFCPPGWDLVVCEDDVKTNGRFRYVWHQGGAVAMTMSGVTKEAVPPERCVRTEKFEMGEGPPMGEQHATMVLVEKGGRTYMTLTLKYDSKEARDGAAASGMEHGMAAGYNLLDEILSER
jgi:uncharacterized protein YndB with AHSA1/START domain